MQRPELQRYLVAGARRAAELRLVYAHDVILVECLADAGQAALSVRPSAVHLGTRLCGKSPFGVVAGVVTGLPAAPNAVQAEAELAEAAAAVEAAALQLANDSLGEVSSAAAAPVLQAAIRLAWDHPQADEAPGEPPLPAPGPSDRVILLRGAGRCGNSGTLLLTPQGAAVAQPLAAAAAPVIEAVGVYWGAALDDLYAAPLPRLTDMVQVNHAVARRMAAVVWFASTAHLQ